MHACSTSTCLPAEIVVDCSYVLAVKASPSDVEMARPVSLRCSGEWASPSRTFFDLTDIITVVQREVDTLFAFIV